MSNTITKKLSKFILKNENPTHDEVEMCSYVLEVFANMITNIGLTLLIGKCMNILDGSIIFLTLFAILRSTTGGYHADTHIKCIFSFQVISIITFAALKRMTYINTSFTCITVSIIMVAMISILAPVMHENNKITEIVRRKNKIRSMTLSFTTLVMVAYAVFSNHKFIGDLGTITLFWVVALIIIEHIKRGLTHEKNQIN